MRKNAPKPYRRLDKADRIAIERGLDKRKPCRQMARELGRSPSTIADEVARNRTACRGPNKGGRASATPEDACPKLLEWPRCCNGCRFRRYHCSKKWRCEYSAARAQALADAELRESRTGVDRGEAEFERAMGLIRSDVARGLSPEQIALARGAEVGASASTIYRWIERGYAGMSSLELRRRCGYMDLLYFLRQSTEGHQRLAERNILCETRSTPGSSTRPSSGRSSSCTTTASR